MKNVCDYIERKSMIHKTKVEYGDYTINHALGCSHGCKYPCYAFLMAKRFGLVSSYEEWIRPKLVRNTLELIRREIPKLKNKIQFVHLCFTTDPFMYEFPEICQMSIDIISLLNAHAIKCTALTKGVLPQKLKDFSKGNEYGITLISLNENYREKYEPYSAKYEDRISSLRYLHENGLITWVSIEPYPTPNIINQNLNVILDKISFVDKIIFGRTNYSKEISQYKEHKCFYNEMAREVISFCKNKNIAYHIKKGTLTEC